MYSAPESPRSYLVGTNLNCKNQNFAYEAYADIQSTLHLFGENQQAFNANFIYGQNGGSPLADAITLTVFDKPYWSKKVPGMEYCKSQTNSLGQPITKGFQVDHTIWVSIVPITFTASADVSLSLEYQW